MGNLVTLKTWAACFLIVAAAACRGPAGNNISGYQGNAAAANEAVPAPEENSTAYANAAATNATYTDTGGATASYHGFGTEPYWSLTIGGGRMRYEPAEGAPIAEPLPARRPIRGGYAYVGRRMAVSVVHRACYEAGEESYPDEVHVSVGGRTLEGCGGRRYGELG